MRKCRSWMWRYYHWISEQQIIRIQNMHTGLAQTQFLHAVNANLWNANFTSSMRKTTFGILSNLNSGAKHFLMGRLPSRAVQHHQI